MLDVKISETAIKNTFLIRGIGKRAIIVELGDKCAATLKHPKSIEFQDQIGDTFTLIEKIIVCAAIVASRQGWKKINVLMLISETSSTFALGKLTYTNMASGSEWRLSNHSVFDLFVNFNKLIY